MANLIEEIKNKKNEVYEQFVQKYGERIDEEVRTIFIEKGKSHWSVGVYGDKRKGTLVGDIYYDDKINGGKFNNLLLYLGRKGFKVTATYWCGGTHVDADGFTITI
jgi:hypothetical protein